jgi:hypothetical protein
LVGRGAAALLVVGLNTLVLLTAATPQYSAANHQATVRVCSKLLIYQYDHHCFGFIAHVEKSMACA